MAPPFEVPVASGAMCRWLWALQRAPGARALYRHELLKREILSYLAPLRFVELHEAVDAALSSQGSGEVRLVRNVTLPAPLNRKALCNRHGSTILWAVVREGCDLNLRSVGGPWRIRHHVPGGNGAAGCALFSVGHGAQLTIHNVNFEIVCVPTGNPVKARLAVLPPQIRESSSAPVNSDSDDLADDEPEEVPSCTIPIIASSLGPVCRATEPVWKAETGSLGPAWRATEATGTMVELSGSSEARGYDSRLVVRGSWAFKDSNTSIPTTGWPWHRILSMPVETVA